MPINYVSFLAVVDRRALSRRSLVGEVAGKAPLGIAKKEEVNIHLNQMRGKVDSATGVVSETRMVRRTGLSTAGTHLALSLFRN